MRHRASAHLKQLTQRVGALRNDKRVIKHFADLFGLVYFGFVSQHDDEHRIVHGVTLSPHHRDEHYCIGTYKNYDVMYVKRGDTLENGSKKKQHRQWHVITFDLHTQHDLPHMLVSVPEHRDSIQRQFNTKFPTKRSLELGHTQHYQDAFLSRYQVYAKPADIAAVEQIISPSVASMLAEHFKGLSFEVSRHVLYVYGEYPYATLSLLETILKNGHWLAESIDQSTTILPSNEEG